MARTKVESNGHPAEAVADAPVVQRAGVDTTTLDMLMQGKDGLLQKRQELLAKVAEVDVLIQRQEGGIMLMQALLQGQGEAVGALDV